MLVASPREAVCLEPEKPDVIDEELMEKCVAFMKDFRQTQYFRLMHDFQGDSGLDAVLGGLERAGCKEVLETKPFYQDRIDKSADESDPSYGKPIIAAHLCSNASVEEYSEERGLSSISFDKLPWEFVSQALFADSAELLEPLLPLLKMLQQEAHQGDSKTHTRYKRVRGKHICDMTSSLDENGDVGILSKSFMFCEDPKEIMLQSSQQRSERKAAGSEEVDDMIIRFTIPPDCPFYVGQVNRGEGILLPHAMSKVEKKYDADGYCKVRGLDIHMDVTLLRWDQLECDPQRRVD